MYFHLYLILDIFSRFVVGRLIAPRESADLAQQLIADTVARNNILPGQVTLHTDWGAAMRSKPVSSPTDEMCLIGRFAGARDSVGLGLKGCSHGAAPSQEKPMKLDHSIAADCFAAGA